MCNYCAGTHNGMLAQSYPWQNSYIAAQPTVVSNDDIFYSRFIIS